MHPPGQSLGQSPGHSLGHSPGLTNIVGTRCVDGDHAALRRWYADHVHLLFGFEGLWQAQLWQRQGAGTGPAPDYLCRYDFASEAAFTAFEASTVHAQAAADRHLGWGREGIVIVQRSAWWRRYRRSVPGAATQLQQVSEGELPGSDAPAALRRLAAHHPAALELYAAHAAQSPATALLWADAATPPELLAPRWSAPYTALLLWQR